MTWPTSCICMACVRAHEHEHRRFVKRHNCTIEQASRFCSFLRCFAWILPLLSPCSDQRADRYVPAAWEERSAAARLPPAPAAHRRGLVLSVPGISHPPSLSGCPYAAVPRPAPNGYVTVSHTGTPLLASNPLAGRLARVAMIAAVGGCRVAWPVRSR